MSTPTTVSTGQRVTTTLFTNVAKFVATSDTDVWADQHVDPDGGDDALLRKGARILRELASTAGRVMHAMHHLAEDTEQADPARSMLRQAEAAAQARRQIEPERSQTPTVQLSEALADQLNLAARFYPKDARDPDTLPCVETAGAQVYAYVEPNGLCVAVHLDTGDIPAELVNRDGTVPIRITVNGTTVFTAS
ncbi:hypothetical protein [Streptomyces sp. NPDC085665]|uniref:hypothetical protein n=1 Tax=Streptomyces sp. NPDC085665 TaxID=3365735 RepID=UPI0037D7C09A